MTGFVDTAARLLPLQTVCHSEAETLAVLDGIRQGQGVRVISFLNMYGILQAQQSTEFADILAQSDILFRDGIGVELVMKQAGMAPGVNLNGTDLIPRIIAAFAPDTPIALFGTRDPALSGAAEVLRARGYRDLDLLDGFHDIDAYVDRLRQTPARLVILAMGMPKQERVSRAIAACPEFRDRDMVVVNGGAILDFMSGQVTRAPEWMRRANLEWLFRLSREPRRLARRITSTLPLLAKAYLHGRAIRQRIDRA